MNLTSMLNRAASALFAAVLLAGLVMTQTASAQTPAAAPPAKPTASHLAAAREVVTLSGIAYTFNAFLPQVAQQILEGVTRTRPEIKAQLEATLKELLPEFNKRTEEMVDTTAALFAGVMSEDDLKATVTFFKSEAGKKYIEMQPRVIDQMVVSLDAWNRKMQDELFIRVRTEMKKKGIDM